MELASCQVFSACRFDHSLLRGLGLLHKQKAQIIHSLIDDETRRRRALELTRGDASALDYVGKKPGMHFEAHNPSIWVGVGSLERHLRRNDRRCSRLFVRLRLLRGLHECVSEIVYVFIHDERGDRIIQRLLKRGRSDLAVD
jgi:hypothetical protein